MAETKPPDGGEPIPDSSPQGKSPGAPPPAPPNPPVEADDRYRCGTLQYTKAGLFVLFSWLIWGDVCFSLFESFGGADVITTYLQDNYRLSNTMVYFLFVLVPNTIGIVLGPIISFKSDRCRSRLGRRIPYMLFTMPLLCAFAIGLGFTDEVIAYVKTLVDPRHAFLVAMIAIGVLTIGFTVFNEFVGTVYYYLFADVVPPKLTGRFFAWCRIIGGIKGWFLGVFLSEYYLTHFKWFHIGVAVLYFVGFGLMCWRVKEGEYPPVTDVTKKTSKWSQTKIYFRECFTHPIYILMYLSAAMGVIVNGPKMSSVFTLHLGKHQSGIVAHGEESAGTGKTAKPPPGHAPGKDADGIPAFLKNHFGTRVSCGSDGKMAVSGGPDGTLKAWRKTEKNTLEHVRDLSTSEDAIRCVAMSPDGKLAASGTSTGTITTHVISESRGAKTLPGHVGPVVALEFSPDGNRLASAGADGTVRIWDITSEKCLNTLTGHTGQVNSVGFSSDGSRLVSGGMDCKIIIWNVAEGTSLRVIDKTPDPAKDPMGPVYTVAFSPAVERIVLPKKERPGFLIHLVRFIPDYFKDIFTRESLYLPAYRIPSRIVGEDRWVISGGRDGRNDYINSKVRVWDAADGRLVWNLVGHKKAISNVRYKHDIRMILSASLDGSVRLWDPAGFGSNKFLTATDQSHKTLSGYTTAVTGMAFESEGPILINASDKGKLHVWNIDEGISFFKAGRIGSFFTLIGILLSYPMGAMVDRFHPVRVHLFNYIFLTPMFFLCFFAIQGYFSLLWLDALRMPFTGLETAVGIPFLIAIFPRAKYGQFCSAAALVRQTMRIVIGLPGALFVDWLTVNTLLTDNYRYVYLWKGLFGLANLYCLFLLYRCWKKMGGEKYVAPET
ncbi:MAG: MFS transporter [Planctomycetota bacterium]